MSFRINRVYTRSGDNGETGVVGGGRIAKIHPRVAAYGEIDELNSVLGVVRSDLAQGTAVAAELEPLIEYLQQELFDLGSQLATPVSAHYPAMWQVGPVHIERLESLCDAYGADLPELTSFVLPGGSRSAGSLHLARSVARRAERAILSFANAEPGEVCPPVIAYVNRLSDLLFILARWVLATDGRTAPLWMQERERALSVEVQARIAKARAGKE